jgi:hypothetical protein
VTPGAAHAARVASRRSAHEWTLPVRVTSPFLGHDGDSSCVDFRAPPEGVLDVLLDRNVNLAGVDAGFPVESIENLTLQFTIGHRVSLLESLRQQEPCGYFGR